MVVTYKCFSCEKKIKEEYVKKKIRCVYCGSRILYKPRSITTKVKAI
ncbi:DNA-directed RNA polymerase subunit P [Candidatus Woesearchaeota archaeon]|nr:DNA-directed RNA polymerase subunit P [Candidatus Woesearchaeota archaeon]